MFAIVKAIHEALHTESTLAFVLAIAIVGGIVLGGVAWIVDKGYRNTVAERTEHQQSIQRAEPPPNIDEKPPTLADLFKDGFPNTMKIDGTSWGFVKGGTRILSGPTKVYLDFDAKTKFISFYVPRSEHAYPVALNLWSQVQATFQSVEKQIAITAGYQQNLTDLKDLTFSGRVFLYHEDAFNLRQLADLVDICKTHGMALDFRGPNFLMDQVMAWHRKHDKKPSDWNIIK